MYTGGFWWEAQLTQSKKTHTIQEKDTMSWKQSFFVGLFFFTACFTPSAFAISDKTCRATGCSGQICSDRDVMSTCEWREDYACYKFSACERQTNGACGWTQTKAFLNCKDTQGDTKPNVTPTRQTCQPRPSCLDHTPRCMIAEPENGWCPPTNTPTKTPQPTCFPRPSCLDRNPPCEIPMRDDYCPKTDCTPRPACFPACNIAEPLGGWCNRTPVPTIISPKLPPWFSLVPEKKRKFLELLYYFVVVFKQPSQLQQLLTGPNAHITSPTPTP